jgi:phosphate starvation-inducible membrane PsiE
MFSVPFTVAVLFEREANGRASRMRSGAYPHLEEMELFVRMLMVWPRIGDVDTPVGVRMERDAKAEQGVTRLAESADRVFHQVEIVAYILLGLLLAVAAVVGMGGTAMLLLHSLQANAAGDTLVIAIDRLLFVLMVIEILHTVRVSFRSGTLVTEPFLVVGLIASIRRVLVITLESSQANQYGKWTSESQELLHSTMLELLVLGGLILVMVLSIYLLRRSRHRDTG